MKPNVSNKASKRVAPVVALAANDSRALLNYRAGLIRALAGAGLEVAGLAADGPEVPALQALGVQFMDIPMAARGKSPFADLRTFWLYLRALRALRPAAFL